MASPDMIGDCEAFSRLYLLRTKKQGSAEIDVKFITRMIQDELEELAEATDKASQIDALLDLVYYALQHLTSATNGTDIRPIWKLIHQANMTKFGEGGYLREDGKWCKPPNFVAPDDAIREELARQERDTQKQKQESSQ